MRVIFTIFIIIILKVSIAHAQIGHLPGGQTPDHTPMMNETWEAIDQMMYKVTTEGSKKVYTPVYPPVLKNLENKIVELPGYIIPLHSGRNHDNFLISVLPVMQCMFCGTNGIPPMVEVFLKKGSVKFREEPIKLKGKLKFNPKALDGNSEIMIVDAVIY